jgi:predicted Zn finger-like uncharacterized protein
MRVECPNCGAKGQVDESKRPPGVNSIRCPKCNGSIPLDATAAVGAADAAGEEPVTAPPPPQPPPTIAPPPVEPVVTNVCSVCNRTFPREEMVRFGPSLVCAACKPTYVQMLEQGASQPGIFRYGGFWIRFVAKFVDGLILGVVNLVLSFLIALPIARPNDPSTVLIASALSTLANFAFAIGMTTWFLGRFGATPGKMAFGLVVVHPDGRSISYGRAFGRYFAELLSSITLGIGYLMVAFDDEKRALHDRICDTRVVYK